MILCMNNAHVIFCHSRNYNNTASGANAQVLVKASASTLSSVKRESSHNALHIDCLGYGGGGGGFYRVSVLSYSKQRTSTSSMLSKSIVSNFPDIFMCECALRVISAAIM